MESFDQLVPAFLELFSGRGQLGADRRIRWPSEPRRRPWRFRPGADLDPNYVWYPAVDGVFLVEASTNCATEPYYATLDSYVKSKGAAGVTILSPRVLRPIVSETSQP